jgi:hypothetical protein
MQVEFFPDLSLSLSWTGPRCFDGVSIVCDSLLLQPETVSKTEFDLIYMYENEANVYNVWFIGIIKYK